MKLSIEGRGRGSLMGGILFDAVCGTLLSLSLVPLLKMLHTLVKHTLSLHRTAVAICSEDKRQVYC